MLIQKVKKQILHKKSKELLQQEANNSPLRRTLCLFELTLLGIGAIIGTDIFVLVKQRQV